MAETDTDAADSFDARVQPGPMDERAPGLFRRYRNLPANVFFISLVSLLNDASSEIIYPLLPVFLAGVLSASPAVIGVIEGAAESVSGLLKLFAGYYSDRRGKRKGPVVFGYALAGLARPLLGFASSWQQVFAVRLTDRVGKGIRSAPRDAMIADSASPAERGLAFGFHRAMDHGGAVLGPLIGYCLLILLASDRNAPTHGEYERIFLVASVPALAAVLVAALLVRETRGGRGPTPRGEESLTGVAQNSAGGATPRDASKPRFSLRGFDSNFKAFLFVLALFTLSNSSDAFLLLRAREAGISVGTIPLLWAALHATKVLSSLVGGDLSDRVGRKSLIVSGWLLYAAVYACFAYVSSPAQAWALFLVYGVYFGLAEGAEKALVADLVRAEQRGTAFGLYNLALSVAVYPASLLMGALWGWRGASFAFLTSAVIGSTAAVLLAVVVRPAAPARAA
ncbi:MAG TPA: MFS transporter [Pyrinomonadaceae bacterium]|jgi:MFS family permease|nr:MFS transporter [Pyrinomonadaceae bacterium]